MSAAGGRMGVQLHGRYWPTEKAHQLLHGGITMKSVPDRLAELLERDPAVQWTADELAKHLHCSYSTARTALKKAHDAGKLTRIQRDHGEWCYSLVVS